MTRFYRRHGQSQDQELHFDYPAGTDTQTTCRPPGPASNTANCDFVHGDLTDVGSYTGAASPNGTFDQGGNLWEWNEAIISSTLRGVRGGSFVGSPTNLAASNRGILNAPNHHAGYGFRVASPVSASPVPSLSPLGMAVLWSLLGFVIWRRLRA